jgi:uncharacterized protein YabE (DUF348 family)
VLLSNQCDSAFSFNALAVIGWTFAGVLLCIVIVFTIIWIRHHVATKQKPSSFSNQQEAMTDSSAYSMMPLRHQTGIRVQKQDTVEYEEIRTVVISDTDHHH